MALSDWAFLPVLLPLIGAAFAFLAKAFKGGRGGASNVLEYLGAFIGLGLPWLALAILFPVVWGGGSVHSIIGSWSRLVGISYRFDGLAWLVDVLGFSVAGAAWIYSLGAGPKKPLFTAIFLIQTSALAATAATSDIFNLFVCLEVLGMASYVLVTMSEKPGAFLAAFSYLMVSAAAMVFFLIGVYGLYRLTGCLSYDDIARSLALLPDSGGPVAVASIASIASAIALRVAVMPLYGWLPDAHALAPHAVSAVLSGVLIKTPLFALSRFLLSMPGGGGAGQLFGYAGAFTALAGVLIALSQKDAKRLLAYHSISQIGFVVCAWGAGVAALARGEQRGYWLMGAAFMHAFYHALFKSLLFLSVGTITDAAGNRDVYQLRNAGSLLVAAGEKVPLSAITYAVGALSICAMPPFNGYGSKMALAFALKGTWEYLFLFAAGIGTIASFIKLTGIFSKKLETHVARNDQKPQPAEGKSYRISVPVQTGQCVLASLCVGTGILSPWLYGYIVRLLSDGEAVATHLSMYDLQSMLKTVVLAVLGYAGYRLVMTDPGKRLAAVVRSRPRDFHGLFAAFSVGLAGLTLWIAYRHF